MANELEKALAETNEILRYLPQEDVQKIPLKLRDLLKDSKKETLEIKIDPHKNLMEQDISDKTKDILTIFYRNYWCNEEEKKELDRALINNERKYQEKLRKLYNPDKIFDINLNVEDDKNVMNINSSKCANSISEDNFVEEEKSLIEVKERWYHRILKCILKLFSGNK